MIQQDEMKKMLNALGETPSAASECAGCNVVHLPLRPRRAITEPLSDDEIRAVVETAHSLGMKVAAHAHRAVFQCCPIARRAAEQ